MLLTLKCSFPLQFIKDNENLYDFMFFSIRMCVFVSKTKNTNYVFFLLFCFRMAHAASVAELYVQLYN